MSYAKRMMSIAAEWLRVNPDPRAPIKPPTELDQLAVRMAKDIIETDEAIARARRAGLTDNARRLEEIRKEFEEVQTSKRLAEAIRLVSTAVNQPYRLTHNKWKRAVESDDNPMMYGTEAHWLLAWARDGYNVFDLSPDFVAAMLLTDPAGIDLSSLKLPFGGVLLTIPEGFAIGAEDTSYTKIHVVETEDSRTFDGDVASKDGEKHPAIAIYASDGVRALATVARRADLSWAALEELPDEVELDVDKEARKTIQRVAFGALAYATAIDRAITERFPEASKKKKREAPKIAHWTIGREIKIDPELVRVARGGAREIAFRIKSRFVVRGHYRNQAHGPARSLRTSKWISPFWKGPEEGAKLVHTYKPEAPEPTSAKEAK